MVSKTIHGCAWELRFLGMQFIVSVVVRNALPCLEAIFSISHLHPSTTPNPPKGRRLKYHPKHLVFFNLGRVTSAAKITSLSIPQFAVSNAGNLTTEEFRCWKVRSFFRYGPRAAGAPYQVYEDSRQPKSSSTHVGPIYGIHLTWFLLNPRFSLYRYLSRSHSLLLNLTAPAISAMLFRAKVTFRDAEKRGEKWRLQHLQHPQSHPQCHWQLARFRCVKLWICFLSPLGLMVEKWCDSMWQENLDQMWLSRVFTDARVRGLVFCCFASLSDPKCYPMVAPMRYPSQDFRILINEE